MATAIDKLSDAAEVVMDTIHEIQNAVDDSDDLVRYAREQRDPAALDDVVFDLDGLKRCLKALKKSSAALNHARFALDDWSEQAEEHRNDW